MTEAERIGTFETSIIPDQDCCTLFVPRHPSTRAHLGDVLTLEARVDVGALVAQAVAGSERIALRLGAEHEEYLAHDRAAEARVQPIA